MRGVEKETAQVSRRGGRALILDEYRLLPRGWPLLVVRRRRVPRIHVNGRIRSGQDNRKGG